MKKISLLLNVVLASLLISMVASPSICSAQDNDALDVIKSRTSIRTYADKPVERAKQEQMLRAAMSAPTANNQQPWSFIVIEKKEILERLAGLSRSVAGAPLAIIVCGDFTKTTSESWIQDCSAASQNILLAAHAQGLGAVWCGVHLKESSVEAIVKEFDLPDYIRPLNIITIGYPDEETQKQQPKYKFKPENVHYNGWITKFE